jgi:23S rRNA (cytosine1962-C5)-methyltransferase
VVDRYADFLVMQCLTAGADAWREAVADQLVELTGIHNLYERSDADVRELEGLAPRIGLLRGAEPPERVGIVENGLKFWVDLRAGHKTGFYLDQRRNRRRLRELAEGREVLNCFSYTGGFAIYALAGGARSALSIDSSAAALALGQENRSLNGLPAERAEWLEGDVFRLLREFRDRRRSFDLVVLDPPKYAPTAAQAEKAARGYKDINLLALKLLRPGGILVTFSCSGGVPLDLFQKIVAGAALDSGAHVEIVEYLAQGPDHPTALSFPEGEYLKGLVCVKTD